MICAGFICINRLGNKKGKRAQLGWTGEHLNWVSVTKCAGVSAPEASSRLAHMVRQAWPERRGSFWKNSFVYSRAEGKENEGGVRAERMVRV